MLSKCIRVPKKDAERVRKELMERGLLRDLKLKRDGDFVLIPVNGDIEGYEMCFDDFEERKRAERIGSFDLVGDVAIIKPREGMDAMDIARKLVEEHRNIRKVALDLGVQGEERIRRVKILIGDNLVTEHREYGIRLRVDLERVYFSPRLATERWRVVSRVKDGETVFDMFAGCGPFTILIAKYRKVRIVATDINPVAIELLKENVRINKVSGVEAILGDAREVAKRIRADRIIMNLPHSSFEFLPHALGALKPAGEIHYYEILPRENKRERDIVRIAEEMDKRVEILEKRRVHSYSPAMDMFAFLIKLI